MCDQVTVVKVAEEARDNTTIQRILKAKSHKNLLHVHLVVIGPK